MLSLYYSDEVKVIGMTGIVSGSVRKIRGNRRSVTGVYVTPQGQPERYESLLERDTYRLLNFHPSVKGIHVQPFRHAHHVPDCLVDTTLGKPLAVDVKFEGELVRNWGKNARMYKNTLGYCQAKDYEYGFVTDAIYGKYRDRLDLLAQVMYLGRNVVPDENKLGGLLALLKDGHPRVVSDVVQEWAQDLSILTKFAQISSYAISKRILVQETRTACINDCWLLANSETRIESPPFFIPYQTFVRRLGSHPLRP